MWYNFQVWLNQKLGRWDFLPGVLALLLISLVCFWLPRFGFVFSVIALMIAISLLVDGLQKARR